MFVVDKQIWIINGELITAFNTVDNRYLFRMKALNPYSAFISVTSLKHIWAACTDGYLFIFSYQDSNNIRRINRMFVIFFYFFHY